MLEQLLIQHAALCWLSLTLAASLLKCDQSISLTLGAYMEKRVNDATRR
jgi:hypothetical protein